MLCMIIWIINPLNYYTEIAIFKEDKYNYIHKTRAINMFFFFLNISTHHHKLLHIQTHMPINKNISLYIQFNARIDISPYYICIIRTLTFSIILLYNICLIVILIYFLRWSATLTHVSYIKLRKQLSITQQQ